MANSKSAKKRIKQSKKRTDLNRYHRNTTRTFVKKARLAIESGDKDAATEAVREASSQLDHAASVGVLHKNNASRRKGRLMKQLAAMD